VPVQACNGIALHFTISNKAVLHTVRAEGDNITASYVSINSMVMGCMESNWMIETKQQMEKNSFAYIFGYKYNALNSFQGLRTSTGYNVDSSFITHSPDNWLVLMS
jgi:hypothetical protein